MSSSGLQGRAFQLTGGIVQAHLQLERGGVTATSPAPWPYLFQFGGKSQHAAVTNVDPVEALKDRYRRWVHTGKDAVHHPLQDALHELSRFFGETLLQSLGADRSTQQSRILSQVGIAGGVGVSSVPHTKTCTKALPVSFLRRSINPTCRAKMSASCPKDSSMFCSIWVTISIAAAPGSTICLYILPESSLFDNLKLMPKWQQ